MKLLSLPNLLAGVLSFSALAGSARAQVAPGLIDPNVASAEELRGLSGMSDAALEALLAKRPFADAAALDVFLARHELDEVARASFYGQAFVHIDLNTASSKQMQLIPGVGKRMAHEFEEYRPWKSWKQFDREIGKYADEAEVARLRKYCFIPLDLNTATDADLLTIPGVGKRMAHEFEEYRPWKSRAHFEKEIGKYADEQEVARLWRYMVIRDPRSVEESGAAGDEQG